MEDWKICYDNTVRNHNDHIIQFKYGDDGFDPIKLNQVYGFIDIPLSDFEKNIKIILIQN